MSQQVGRYLQRFLSRGMSSQLEIGEWSRQNPHPADIHYPNRVLCDLNVEILFVFILYHQLISFPCIQVFLCQICYEVLKPLMHYKLTQSPDTAEHKCNGRFTADINSVKLPGRNTARSTK